MVEVRLTGTKSAYGLAHIASCTSKINCLRYEKMADKCVMYNEDGDYCEAMIDDDPGHICSCNGDYKRCCLDAEKTKGDNSLGKNSRKR